jgi:hypothetical protein
MLRLKNILRLAVLSIVAIIAAGCQSEDTSAGKSPGAGAAQAKASDQTPVKGGVTPTASGKTLDSEQQKVIDHEAQSAGK